MGVQFQHRRVVDLSGSFPEPDPNVSPPAPGTVFRLEDRPPAGRLTMGTRGDQVYLWFADAGGAPVPGAKASWQTWFRDDASGRWVSAEAVTDSGHAEGWITSDIKGADCFVRLTDVAAALLAGAATAEIAMSEVQVPRISYKRVGASPPGPSPGGAAAISVGDDVQRYALGTNEVVLAEDTVDFAALSGTQAQCTLLGLTAQTGGATGTYRVRVGGTPGNADGAIVVALMTTQATYPATPDAATGAAFPMPTGPQLVALTGVASAPGERARVRAFRADFVGA